MSLTPHHWSPTSVYWPGPWLWLWLPQPTPLTQTYSVLATEASFLVHREHIALLPATSWHKMAATILAYHSRFNLQGWPHNSPETEYSTTPPWILPSSTLLPLELIMSPTFQCAPTTRINFCRNVAILGSCPTQFGVAVYKASPCWSKFTTWHVIFPPTGILDLLRLMCFHTPSGCLPLAAASCPLLFLIPNCRMLSHSCEIRDWQGSALLEVAVVAMRESEFSGLAAYNLP